MIFEIERLVKNMKSYDEITAMSALRRRSSAPQIVVVAPSGSGKSTLVYLLLNNRLAYYTKIGIGDKSQTTIMPCEFCFDERIADEKTFAIQISKKDYVSKDIHIVILTALMDLFGKNECDTDETIDALDKMVFEQILEPEEALYHLGMLRNDISLDELKNALRPILNYMVDNEFRSKVRQRRNELKSKKVKIAEVRELIFEEMFEEMSEDIKHNYIEWLDKIGATIAQMLQNAIGDVLFSQKMVEYDLSGANNGASVLSSLFDPQTPYSLIIDHISIASRPRNELIDIAQSKSPEFPFRFCIRDTMGLTQKGIDAASTKSALEVALNCKADAILFLMSLEERDDTLTECCKALMEKKDELNTKSHLNTSVYVLFTKADRIVENLINKRNNGGIYIDEETYSQNIQEVLSTVENMVHKYSAMISQEEMGWLSMRYLKDSYLLKSLGNDVRMHNFEPEGLFEKIVEFSMKTLQSTLPIGIANPLFVSSLKPDEPVIQVSVDPQKIRTELELLQYKLCEESDIVNGYIIRDGTPTLHGRSVSTYWHKLTIGLGHTTNASVYGNFSINMKGLLKRVLYNSFASFVTFDQNSAITFTADNLKDDVLTDTVKKLLSTDDIESGINPALGERNIALQRLYEFYVDYFMDKSRFATLVDRVAYDMSYANTELKQCLTHIYRETPGYDKAMRKLQNTFRIFFGSEHFVTILTAELDQALTDMVNKTFIII